MTKGKSVIGLAAAFALSAGAVFISIGAVAADPGDKVDITICHRDHATSKPYVVNSPNTEGQLEGHFNEHQGPIFNAADPPEEWGDIIPPFGDGDLADGLNWTDAGQAILDNGCEIPFGDVSVHKAVVDTGGVAVAGQAYSIDLTCTLDDDVILEETVSLTAGETSSAFTDVQGGAHCDAVENTAGIANLASVTSDGPVTVVGDDEVTVTITNTFTVPVTPVTPVTPVPNPEAAVAVRAQSRFTG
jgi:hypothetical protein